jgi:tripeptide aminopeptidase
MAPVRRSSGFPVRTSGWRPARLRAGRSQPAQRTSRRRQGVLSLPERRAATDDLVADIVALSEIPAPTFHEQPRLDWLEHRLAALPGSRHRDTAGNLIWRFGASPPRVVVTAHVDTVFAADIPLTVRRRDGRLHGPGVGDNSAAIATVIGVLEELAAEGGVDLDSAVVAFTVGEEGLGNLHGARAVCEALRPAVLIALEGHGLDSIYVDAVGSLRATIVVEGPGGHSWVDRGRPSAVHTLLALGTHLVDLGTGAAPVNVGIVAGGRSVNAIAAEARLHVEIRALEDQALDRFADELGKLAVEPPLTIRIEEKGRRPAGRLQVDAQVLRVVREVRAELGLPIVLSAASTDANAALGLSVPALALGVARGGGMHTVNEWIEIASLPSGWLQLSQVLRRLLGATRS